MHIRYRPAGYFRIPHKSVEGMPIRPTGRAAARA